MSNNNNNYSNTPSPRRLTGSFSLSFVCDPESHAIDDLVTHLNNIEKFEYNLMIASSPEHKGKIYLFNKEDIIINKDINKVVINVKGVQTIDKGLRLFEVAKTEKE